VTPSEEKQRKPQEDTDAIQEAREMGHVARREKAAE